jgi:hypothetical protein
MDEGNPKTVVRDYKELIAYQKSYELVLLYIWDNRLISQGRDIWAHKSDTSGSGFDTFKYS